MMEAQERYPNVVKLAEFIDEQDRPTQIAALLLVIAAGRKCEPASVY